jgi:drug/metabolite transporter (DMT)-like permease
MPSPQPLRGVAFALACLATLSVMPIISSSRPEGFSALGFAFWLSLWQTIFAAPLFLAELRGPRRGIFGPGVSAASRRRSFGVTLAMGATFGLATLLYVLAIERAGTVNASVAIQSMLLFSILWESLFLRRHKTALELALTAALVGALYYLGTAGSWRLAGLSPWFLVALAVPFLWSIAHVIVKEELGRTPITPAQVTFLRVALSTLFLAAALAFFAPAGFAEAMSPRAMAWAAAMGLVYFLELITWFHAIRHIDVSFASSITDPWPALTMLLAWGLLGEAIAPYQAGAVAVVILATWGLLLAGLAKHRA